jgi:pyridoxine 5-phosphate synthase
MTIKKDSRITSRLKLGVNIDHVATLRQVRRTEYPDLPAAARCCESAGAAGITVHLREDRRHIQDRDVYALRRSLKSRLNLEMANASEIVEIALDVHPDEVCLVPERRRELTTEGGLDVVNRCRALTRTVRRLSTAGISVSLFVAPDRWQIEAAAETGAPYIELHTGAFCDASGREARREQERLVQGAEWAHERGLRVNAGHGINLDNVRQILRIPHLDTLNIGHSIVCRAVYVGLFEATAEMRRAMARYGRDRLR